MVSGGGFADLDPARVPSPCYVIDLARLELNLRRLRSLADMAGVRVLLALKAFSCFPVADLIGRYLDGAAASGLYEARLAKTRFSGEVHTYAPGLKHGDLADILDHSDHLVLNSLSQWRRFKDRLGNWDGELGLRVNPGHREVANPLYDPCAPWSRLGVPAHALKSDDLVPFDGLHVHGLCDHGFDAFARFLGAVRQTLGHLLGSVRWINLGGGVLLTDDAFPLDRAVALLGEFRAETGLEVYLEPGTAVAHHAGAVVSEVVDISRSQGNVAILDASATCHMPDVIEMPFTPDIVGGETIPGSLMNDDAVTGDPSVWRLGGPTCLAGDEIGAYRLPHPPCVGDRLIFLDLAPYTMVKSTTFNGAPLPAIALWDRARDEVRVVREFGYDDFEGRLG